MTKTNIKIAALAVAVAFASASVSKADGTWSGFIWTSATSGLANSGAASDVPPASALPLNPEISFTMPAGNFFYSSPSATYTEQGFLTSVNATGIVGSAAALAHNFNLTLVEITGSITLYQGEVLNVLHDDGLRFYLDGTQSVNEVSGFSDPERTAADLSTMTVSAAQAGTHTFTLLYAEVNGQPAVLNFTAVPEPTTFLAGALLLLPFGASAMRMVRKNKQA